MKKLKNNSVILILMFLIFVSLNINVYAADSQKINAIDYDIQVNKDGSVIVEEIWDVQVNPEIGIIEKEFENEVKVTGAKVYEYDDRGNVKLEYTCVDTDLKEKEFSNIKSAEGKNVIKIKPTIPADARIYFLLTYKLENVYKKYNDCTDINIVLQNSKFNFNSNQISGRIRFENPVDSKEYKAWITSNEKSEIGMRDDNIVYFVIDRNTSNQPASLRIVLLNDAVECEEDKIIKEDKLNSIVNEENAKIEVKKEQERIDTIFDIIILVVCAVIVIIISIIIIIVTLKRIKAKKIEKSIDELDDLEDVKTEQGKEELKENNSK